MNEQSIKLISITPEATGALQDHPAVVTSVRESFVYSHGERTDTHDGFTIAATTISGPLAGTEFRIKTNQDPQVTVGNQINVKIDSSNVYARTSANSTFASIEFSLTGTVTPMPIKK